MFQLKESFFELSNEEKEDIIVRKLGLDKIGPFGDFVKDGKVVGRISYLDMFDFFNPDPDDNLEQKALQIANQI
ncbi:hypothetical protein KKA66_03535 [Patescibacteria group bacterium]|nr:hypothetical protein [Patescibacteria group bacterium]